MVPGRQKGIAATGLLDPVAAVKEEKEEMNQGESISGELSLLESDGWSEERRLESEVLGWARA